MKNKIWKAMFALHGKWMYWLSRRGQDVPLACQDNDVKRCGMLIITVAFNHERLIKKQIEMVRRYVKDADYKHIIADNSTDPLKREQIRQVCADEGTEYVPIPRYINKYCCTRLFWNGNSHGGALNWLYYHYIKPRDPERFAFLDHDIFPTLDSNLTALLGDAGFKGVGRIHGKYSYLWPGFSIFRMDKLKEYAPNFLPVIIGDEYLDSGGGNHLRIYRHYQPLNRYFVKSRYARFQRTPSLHGHNDVLHGDTLELIDERWLHLINGSNCARIPGKEATVDKILDDIYTYSPRGDRGNE